MITKIKCIHHWHLNDSSYGVCQKCGAERQFKKYIGKGEYTYFKRYKKEAK